jgi:signal transduction histidine kinase
VTLAVQDTGIGIPADDLPHIFERFYRCDQSRSEPGTGLGLSLARALARAHQGDITVTSTPGQRSTSLTCPGQRDIAQRHKTEYHHCILSFPFLHCLFPPKRPLPLPHRTSNNQLVMIRHVLVIFMCC